jgi:branched-chain amino acid transport system permease protein
MLLSPPSADALATGVFPLLTAAPLQGGWLPGPTVFAQLVVFSILLGGIYGLVALGLTMIFGVMDVVNFAHGAFLVVAMYTVWFVSGAVGLSPFLVIPVAVVVLFVLGVIVHRATIAPIMEAPQENQLIVTFGVFLILVSLLEMSFTSTPRGLDLELGSFGVAGVFIPEGQFIALVIAVVAVTATWLFLRRTMLGRAIRGTADNREGARYVGINVPRIDYLTFGIGAALAGLAGAAIPLFQQFDPFLGEQYLINAFVVVVLGGLGSFPGALLGGLVIGFVQVFGAFFLPGTFYQVLIFSIFIAILLFKPSGLLGGAAGE